MTKEKLLEEIDRERKWLDEVGYTAYNVDVAFSSICKNIKALEQTDILGKIKEQIIEEKDFAYADFDEYKEQVLYADADDLPDDDFRFGMLRCLEIINIAENEVSV